MGHVVWTPTAIDELDDIIHYIGFVDRRYLVAEALYYEIKQRVEDQWKRDLPGHRHPAAPTDWRYLRHKRWLIFYRPLDDGIEVMRIVDGARDLPSTL